MSQDLIIARVAIPTPLSHAFDYLLPSELGVAEIIGSRVEVPFGRTSRVGVVVARADNSAVPIDKLKPISRILDRQPTVPGDVLRLVEWAGDYYHHPIGDAVATALPAALRKPRTDSETAAAQAPQLWRLTAAGLSIDLASMKRSPLRCKIVDYLKSHPVAGREQLSQLGASWRQCIVHLVQVGLVETCDANATDCGSKEAEVPECDLPCLNVEQQKALELLNSVRDGFQPFLIDGVTGSGKTEIYLRYARQISDSLGQVLVIVPEIGLTPQLLARFTRRFGRSVVTVHSGLSDHERLRNWRRAEAGDASVVIGTRSSVFTPFKSLGLIIVDEEHDGSLKQQDGFRYHARDLALVRARDADIPIIIGSATPSLESLHNARNGKYRHIRLINRAGSAQQPLIQLLDVRRHPMNEGLSNPLVDKMKQHINAGNQVMLFLNRRGYAPVMLCDTCGEITDCRRCDSHMTVHAASRRLRCHHCGAERPVPVSCEACGSRELAMAGQGTERIDYALRALFPEQQVVRIDRDTTRRKGSLQEQLEQARSGAANILVGTQMLAKGHHFPRVTLVAILDVDRGLFGVDFRAAEQMAQTIIQVAGRSGRAEHAGEVIIQTRNPDSELFQTLIHRGYHAFADTLLVERKALALPPFSNIALLRAEATRESSAKTFLQSIRRLIDWERHASISVLGPAPAPIERVAGRYRAQLLLRSAMRKPLHSLLSELRGLLESSRESRSVRWSLDVDPIDLM